MKEESYVDYDWRLEPKRPGFQITSGIYETNHGPDGFDFRF